MTKRKRLLNAEGISFDFVCGAIQFDIIPQVDQDRFSPPFIGVTTSAS